MTVTAATMQNLDRANHVRKVRAGLRRDLKALSRGEAMAVVADVVEDGRDEFRKMRLDELLVLCPNLGTQAAVRLMVAVRVSAHRTVGELSDRQRSELVALLRGEEQ